MDKEKIRELREEKNKYDKIQTGIEKIKEEIQDIFYIIKKYENVELDEERRKNYETIKKMFDLRMKKIKDMIDEKNEIKTHLLELFEKIKSDERGDEKETKITEEQMLENLENEYKNEVKKLDLKYNETKRTLKKKSSEIAYRVAMRKVDEKYNAKKQELKRYSETGTRIVVSPEIQAENFLDYEFNSETIDEKLLIYDKKNEDKTKQQTNTDIAIMRNDGTEVIIRRTDTEVIGIKKYQILYELDRMPSKENVREIYSEDIDFEQLYKNPEYAKMIRKLIDEDNLSMALEEARSRETDVGYIGTVVPNDKGQYEVFKNEGEVLDFTYSKIKGLKSEEEIEK